MRLSRGDGLGVLMLVELVMHVLVFMFERVVIVLVNMRFRQVQPDPERHEA